MSKELLFSDEARLRLQKGINKIADAVKTTLGPGGRNVVIQKFGYPHITKDGVTVAKDIILEDVVENIGAEIIKRAAVKTGEVAGDGTTTSTVLAQQIFNDGIENINSKNPVEMKVGMDLCAKVIVDELKKMSVPVDGDMEKIRHIALISSNNDKEVADLITEAMSKIKKEGVITVEESRGFDTRIEVVEGMKFQRGYLSPFFITNPEKMECVLEKPYILLHDRKIGTVKEMVKILERVMQERRSILFIAEDIEGEALSSLALNKMEGILKSAAVRNPGFGDDALEYLNDIAVVTGASVVSEQAGYSVEKMDLSMLGTAEKIIITKESTTIIGGGGNKDNIQARVNQLNDQIENADNPQVKAEFKKRLAALDGGVAVLYIGAPTEIEMRERKDRVDDALHATKAAMEEGIVPGGGVALVRVFSAIQNMIIGKTESEIHGATIVKRALLKPFEQIIYNATGDPAQQMLNKILSNQDFWYGFNSRTKEYGNLQKTGVIDPTKVVRASIENAVSVAGILLTTECVSFNIQHKTE